MMEAAPIAPLVVPKPELLFELKIITFNAPAHLHGIDQPFEAHLFGQRAQEILGGMGLGARPLDEQPFFCTQHLTVCRTHPLSGKPRREPSVRAFAPLTVQ